MISKESKKEKAKVTFGFLLAFSTQTSLNVCQSLYSVRLICFHPSRKPGINVFLFTYIPRLSLWVVLLLDEFVFPQSVSCRSYRANPWEFPSVDKQLGKKVIHVTETGITSQRHTLTHRHKVPSHWHIVHDTHTHTHTHIHIMCVSCTSSNTLVIYGHAEPVKVILKYNFSPGHESYTWKVMLFFFCVLFHNNRDMTLKVIEFSCFEMWREGQGHSLATIGKMCLCLHLLQWNALCTNKLY